MVRATARRRGHSRRLGRQIAVARAGFENFRNRAAARSGNFSHFHGLGTLPSLFGVADARESIKNGWQIGPTRFVVAADRHQRHLFHQPEPFDKAPLAAYIVTQAAQLGIHSMRATSAIRWFWLQAYKAKVVH